MDDFFLKGLSKWIVNIAEEHYLKFVNIAIGSLFKSKNETKEKVLNKR